MGGSQIAGRKGGLWGYFLLEQGKCQKYQVRGQLSCYLKGFQLQKPIKCRQLSVCFKSFPLESLRRFDPSHGPERISHDLERLYRMKVPPSTVYAILKREKLVARKLAARLTKRHLKRYRRPLPDYLQVDFKYVPYRVQGKQLYQLSCVDHHSSWRFIRIYPEKSTDYVMNFLKELRRRCPFPIVEIQTDNDTAFTDKFSSGLGVTGDHRVDRWCAKHGIRHKLIPVGVKELNGKVENTHKQDDREFYAKGPYPSHENIALNIQGYNEHWNQTRRTKALGWQSPEEVLWLVYVRALAWVLWLKSMFVPTEDQNVVILPAQRPNKTRKKLTAVQRYLQFLEWDQKNRKHALLAVPTISQKFSSKVFSLLAHATSGSLYQAYDLVLLL